jgi:carboxymethylenebutenolidase
MASEHGNDGFDLGAVFDEHVRAEFELRDADGTIDTMTAEPYLNHVPVATGASGREALREFYRDRFIPSWAADTEVVPISRTVGEDRIVDELLVRFTHSQPMPFNLPGVSPTGRRVELPHVVVVGFEGGKVAYEHVYWDQASLLVQVGLLDADTVPALGIDQAHKLMDRSLPSNELIERAERRPRR